MGAQQTQDQAATEPPVLQPPAAAGPQLTLAAGLTPPVLLSLQRRAGNAAVTRALSGEAGLRRCACGGIVGPDGECEACRRRRLGQSAARMLARLTPDEFRKNLGSTPDQTAASTPCSRTRRSSPSGIT